MIDNAGSLIFRDIIDEKSTRIKKTVSFQHQSTDNKIVNKDGDVSG